MEKREFTAAEAARILHVPEKKVIKLADDGELAGQKVQGQWLFSKADMILWFEKTLTGAKSDDHLEHIEKLAEDVPQETDEEPGIAELTSRGGVLIPFPAKTRDSVIRTLTQHGVEQGLIWDPDLMIDALRKREEMMSTAMENGVALLHPRRPMPYNIGDSFLILGVSLRGVPFGGGFNNLTDLFFLIGALDDKTHLRTLAGIGKILKHPEFLPRLRELETPEEILDWIKKIEKET
jgi:PTS system nitrogen regulatory IIA component